MHTFTLYRRVYEVLFCYTYLLLTYTTSCSLQVLHHPQVACAQDPPKEQLYTIKTLLVLALFSGVHQTAMLQFTRFDIAHYTPPIVNCTSHCSAVHSWFSYDRKATRAKSASQQTSKLLF